MAPGVVSSGVVQINMFIGLIMTSFLPEGSISYCNIADRLYQLPLSVIGVAMGTALLPLLSKKIQQKDWAGIRSAQRRSVEFSLFLSAPAAVAFMIIGAPILTVLFQRNAFTPTDVQVTQTILFAFATGLPAFILLKIFSAAFFAFSDTKTPMKYAIISVIINSILNIVLVLTIGISGIGWATSIASWVNVFLLGRKLYHKKLVEFKKIVTKFLPKLIFSCTLMAIVLHFLGQKLAPHFSGSETERILALALLMCAGFITYIAPSYSLGIVQVK